MIYLDSAATTLQKPPAVPQLSIKQVLRNKYYGSCRTRVTDKRGMCH